MIRRLYGAALLSAFFAAWCEIPTAAGAQQFPLTLKAQGSFFVGGRDVKSDTIARTSTTTDIWTRDQMYVAYQLPLSSVHHVPIVLIHGCCLTGKTWETTPDGRPGWYQYFAQREYPVYAVDQVARGRSGFDPSVINAVGQGKLPASQVTSIFTAGHEGAWNIFRFGPTFNHPWSNELFPYDALPEFWKQMVPDLNSSLPQTTIGSAPSAPKPTIDDLSLLAIRLKQSVLVSHSESGAFPFQAALTNPQGISGIVEIEGNCPAAITTAQLAVLAKIPSMILFGDHVFSKGSGASSIWPSIFRNCQAFAGKLAAAGGDVTFVSLPDLGVYGNSHMLMQDRNNLDIGNFIANWVAAHVEHKAPAVTKTEAREQLLRLWQAHSR